MNWLSKRPLDFFTLPTEKLEEWNELPVILALAAKCCLFAACLTVMVVILPLELSQISPRQAHLFVKRCCDWLLRRLE